MTNTPFSKRLTEAKDTLGYSTRQIVREAERHGYNISLSTVSHCLTGKHGKVTANTVRALSKVLRVPYVELARLASLPTGEGHFRLEGKLAEYADALTKPQADVVRDTIRLFAEGNQAAGTEPGKSSIQQANEEVRGNDDTTATPIDDSTVVPIHGSGYRVHTEEDTDDPETLAADKGDHHRTD